MSDTFSISLILILGKHYWICQLSEMIGIVSDEVILTQMW